MDSTFPPCSNKVPATMLQGIYFANQPYKAVVKDGLYGSWIEGFPFASPVSTCTKQGNCLLYHCLTMLYM